MIRSELVTTRVRPVKKAYVLGPRDLGSLRKIVVQACGDLGGIRHIVLPLRNKSSLDSLLSFVDYHDPDIVVAANSTPLSADVLAERLRRRVVRLDSETARTIGTPIAIDERLAGDPEILGRPILFVDSTGGNFQTDFALVAGCRPAAAANDPYAGFERWDLVGLRPPHNKKRYLQTLKDVLAGTHLWLLSLTAWQQQNRVLAGGHAAGAWPAAPGRGQGHLFAGGASLIMGRSDHVEDLCYYWNMRATFPTARIIWLPMDYLSSAKDLQGMIELLGRPGETVRLFAPTAKVSERCTRWVRASPGLEPAETDQGRLGPGARRGGPPATPVEILPFQWVTHGFEIEWENTRATQQAAVGAGQRLLLAHPLDRGFSSRTGRNLMLDIGDFPEADVPQGEHVGRAFVGDADDTRLVRTSKYGISVFIDSDRGVQLPLSVDLYLPRAEELFTAYFAGFKVDLRPAKDHENFQQMLKLLGGLDQARWLQDELTLGILHALTPPRAKTIARYINQVGGRQVSESNMARALDLLQQNAVLHIDVVRTASQLATAIGLRRELSGRFERAVEFLAARRILLRGKSFPCRFCRRRVWWEMGTAQPLLICEGCGNRVDLPVFAGGRDLPDTFRLNEQFIAGVDQGQVPVLLTALQLQAQRWPYVPFVVEHELFAGDAWLAEVDLIFGLGNRIGLCEVKSNTEFDLSQIRRQVSQAGRVGAALVLLASLFPEDSAHYGRLRKDLAKFSFPILLIGKETLLGQRPLDIGREMGWYA